jgi:hypothetical protein
LSKKLAALSPAGGVEGMDKTVLIQLQAGHRLNPGG